MPVFESLVEQRALASRTHVVSFTVALKPLHEPVHHGKVTSSMVLLWRQAHTRNDSLLELYLTCS